MTVKLRRTLTRLFLFFTMLAFTVLFLIFAGNAVKKWRETELSLAIRLADGFSEELLQEESPAWEDLCSQALESRTWLFLSDGQNEQAGPECFPTPLAVLKEQLLSGSKVTGTEAVTPAHRAGDVFNRTTHRLTGNHSEIYYGIELRLDGSGSGDYVLILIYPCAALLDILREECRLYPLLWLLAFAVMYGMSRFLIQRTLLPVEAAMKSQKEFIAAASHELKTPLAVIQANAEAMKPADENGEETCGRERAVILEECGHMTTLIGSLLTLAATDAGSFRIEQKETDMDTLLIETWEAFLPACRKKEINLHLDTGEDCCPKVFCDGERIGQVLRILLDNALDHSPAGSPVTLKASVLKSRKGDMFACSVIDHGPGIPAGQRERVFERFFCGDASRTDRNHFGLGLSIAKEIIEKHHGILTFFDTPGGGCTFEFRLPVSRT